MYIATNNAVSQLAATLSDTATDFTVLAGDGDKFPAITSPNFTFVTLEDEDGNYEIMKVTQRVGTEDTFEVDRHQQGTTARTWTSGSIVECRLTASTINELIAHTVDTEDAHPATAISFTPTDSLDSEDVQAAIEEVDGKILSARADFIDSHVDGLEDVHPAEAISYIPDVDSTIVSEDVQGAIDELEVDKFPFTGGKFTGAVDYRDPVTVTAGSSHLVATTDANDIVISGTGNIRGLGVPEENARARREVTFQDGVNLLHNDLLTVSHATTPSEIEYTAQVSKAAFTGTPAEDDVYTITLNSVAYTHTVVDGDTKDDIAEAIVALMAGLVSGTLASIKYDKRRKIITFTGLENGASFTVTGTSKITVTTPTAAATTAAVAQVSDLNFNVGYAPVEDDLFVAIVDGAVYTYTVLEDDTLAEVAAGIILAMAASIGSGKPIASAQYQSGNNRIRLTGQNTGVKFDVSSAFYLPNSQDILALAGDIGVFDFTGNAWHLVKYYRKNARPLQDRARVAARQCIVSSAVALAIGTGLNVDVSASAGTPFMTTVASGFDESGQVDYVNMVKANITGAWEVEPLNKSFLYQERNAVSGRITYGTTMVPPQYGKVFSAASNALLHLNGADTSTTVTDAYGNTWSPMGSAAIRTTQSKFGGASLYLNGTTDWLETTAITSFSGEWTLEAFVYFSGLPTSGTLRPIFGTQNTTGFDGFRFEIQNTSGTTKLRLYASSNNSSWDIASAVLGTKTNWVTGQFYHIAISFDGSAYRVFVDGQVDISVGSSLKLFDTFYGIKVGKYSTNYLNGFIDELRFSSCARYTQAFTVPTVPFTEDTHWFDTSRYKMYYGGPTVGWTEKQRVFVGEALADGTAVTSLIQYASLGGYESTWFSVLPSNSYVKSHNLGVVPYNAKILYNLAADDYAAFEVTHDFYVTSGGTSTHTGAAMVCYSNTLKLNTGNSALDYPNAGGIGMIDDFGSNVKGYYKVVLERGW